MKSVCDRNHHTQGGQLMDQEGQGSEDLQVIEDMELIKEAQQSVNVIRPSLISPIFSTMVALGPILGPVFYSLIEIESINLIKAIGFVLGWVWIILSWLLYIKQEKEYKHYLTECNNKLKEMNINFKISSTKDRKDIVTERIAIIVLVSLGCFFCSVILIIIYKVPYLKYIVLISLFVFIVSLIVLAIIEIYLCMRNVFKYLKARKKAGKADRLDA